MREIKFRAWQTERREMIPHERVADLNRLVDYDYEHAIPLEFIGRCDKNGTEIYEGDIVRQNERYGVIKYFTEYARFACSRNFEYDMLPMMILNFSAVEVVGNIYENPELLNG